MIEILLKNKKPNYKKLTDFGFEKINEAYVYCCDIADGQMSLTVAVSGEGKMSAEMVDKNTGEEYVLHRVSATQGSFVGRVKTEYASALDEIFSKCFEPEVFKSEQAKEIIAYIKRKYNDELEFLWQKFPDNAVARRKDSKKWYVAFLTVSRRKLGFDSDEAVEIVDLRIKSDDIQKTVDNARYFPGYHMNKKHWITVCLDGKVSLEELFARIDDSYGLATK